MKIVKLELSRTERKRLEELQVNGSNQMRERSLALLHCAAGKKITWIAEALNRRHLTIRSWIKAFRENGISGLERSYSPGRPSYRQKELLPRLTEYPERSPRDYGWAEDLWSIKTINAQVRQVQYPANETFPSVKCFLFRISHLQSSFPGALLKLPN